MKILCTKPISKTLSALWPKTHQAQGRRLVRACFKNTCAQRPRIWTIITRLAIAIPPLFILIGCATTYSTSRESSKGYLLNKVQTANVGDVILYYEDKEYLETKKWVGIFQSGDGWERTNELTDNSFREELVYSGITKKTIRMLYREYKKDLARPVFFQELTYDLGESKIVGFRKYQIEVIKATNQFINYKVLKDGK